MLTQVEEAKQKWGGAHDAIDTWLQDRQKLLVQYCELAGLPPFERDSAALPKRSSIRDFCEHLVDYVSAGHFEMYDKIAAECDSNNAIAEKIYPAISDTTEAALNFNDHFADISDQHDLDTFDVRLSELGQQLEERFELEDQLIQNIHQEHV